MNTYPLYYDSPYENEFTARILQREKTKHGTAVVLDRTLFYPEGGGQPSDLGTLGGAEVTEVKKRDGEIWHFLKGEPEERADGTAAGSLDWGHRYDFMQQHTGQHLLSAVMYRRYGYETMSVHLGGEYITIEVEADSITREVIEGFEDEAASLIARNLPVQAYWVAEEKAGKLDLRREPKVSGNIRIVQVDDYDAVACGGVHTAATGEVKLVKHIDTERIRGRQRLYWKVGDRAVRDYRLRTRVTAELSDLFSVPPEQLTERARGTVDELTALRREKAAYEERVASLEVTRLVEAAERVGEFRVAFGEFHGESKEFLRRLAEAVKEEQRCLLAAVNYGEKGMQWVIAAGPGSEIDFNRHRVNLLEPIAGKGGGKTPVWQGVGEEPGGVGEFYRRVKELLAAEKASGGE